MEECVRERPGNIQQDQTRFKQTRFLIKKKKNFDLQPIPYEKTYCTGLQTLMATKT